MENFMPSFITPNELESFKRKSLVCYSPQSVTIFYNSALISPVPSLDEAVLQIDLASIFYQGEEYIMPDMEEIITLESSLGIIRLEPENKLPAGLYEINLELHTTEGKKIVRRVFAIRILPTV